MMFIDCFSVGIDDLPKKKQRSTVEVLRVLQKHGRFSCFEASANDVIASTMRNICHGGYVETKDIGYPGDVDGDVIQGHAEQCGLIEEKHMDRPCAENCSCTDFGEFPTKCFFYTDLGKQLIDLTRGGEQT